MNRRIETPVDGPTARRLLSPTGDPSRPMSRAMYSAILKAMGMPGVRLVFVSQIVGFLKKNPNFRRSQIYPARDSRGVEAGGCVRERGAIGEMEADRDGKEGVVCV